jgi:hypothetical protein
MNTFVLTPVDCNYVLHDLPEVEAKQQLLDLKSLPSSFQCTCKDLMIDESNGSLCIIIMHNLHCKHQEFDSDNVANIADQG